MSDFVPMTRERLRNFSDGAVEGFVEQLAETALAYLDRAEQDEVAMMRALDLRDKFAAEVVVATQRAEQAEQEAARERERAEKWKALAVESEILLAHASYTLAGQAREDERVSTWALIELHGRLLDLRLVDEGQRPIGRMRLTTLGEVEATDLHFDAFATLVNRINPGAIVGAGDFPESSPPTTESEG